MCHSMSQSGQHQGAVVTGRLELARGRWFASHRHDQHQLVWAARGVASVLAVGRTWVLPPGLALWVPAGVEHETGVKTAADLLGIYVDPARCPIKWSEPTVVAVGGLVRELLTHLLDGVTTPSIRRHAELLLFDLLRPVGIVEVDVDVPSDPRAAEVASALRADPSDQRSLDMWGRSVSTSGRTLARVWSAQTGVAFGSWRTRLRVQAALPMLADGMPVGTVARRVGYQTPSAFVAAFRREVGVSPGAYFAAGG